MRVSGFRALQLGEYANSSLVPKATRYLGGLPTAPLGYFHPKTKKRILESQHRDRAPGPDARMP